MVAETKWPHSIKYEQHGSMHEIWLLTSRQGPEELRPLTNQIRNDCDVAGIKEGIVKSGLGRDDLHAVEFVDTGSVGDAYVTRLTIWTDKEFYPTNRDLVMPHKPRNQMNCTEVQIADVLADALGIDDH